VSDFDRLQGRWRQVASSIDGAPETAAPIGDEFAGALTAVFAADTFRVLDPDGATVLEGRFLLEEAARAIDWIDSVGPDAGNRLPALYELGATTLAFAVADSGMPRPTHVRAAPGITFRRCVRDA